MGHDTPFIHDPRTAADLSALTKKELLLIARERGLRRRYAMSKGELIAALCESEPVASDVADESDPPLPSMAPTTGGMSEPGVTSPIDDALLVDDGAIPLGSFRPTLSRPDDEKSVHSPSRIVIWERPGLPEPIETTRAGEAAAARIIADSSPVESGAGDEDGSPREGGTAVLPFAYVTVGSLYERDDSSPGLLGSSVVASIALYVILNRLISDRFVLPIGTSIRLYEVALMLIGLLWVLWVVTDPRPMPYGAPAIAGLFLVVVVGLAPFIHAPTLNAYQADGAERGLFRMFVFLTLFLAAYHVAFRLRSGLTLLAVVVASTVGQAAFALYEFVTEKPVELLDKIAVSLGLILDPLSIRPELEEVFQRTTGEIRAVATAPHPIVLSAVIAVGVLVAGAWLLFAREARAKRWLAVGAIVLLIGLPVSNSRTGFVIVVALSIPLLLLLFRELPKIITWSIPLILALGVAFMVSPGTPRLLLNSFTEPGSDPNTVVRIERFQRLPELLEPRPFVGAGYLTHDPEILFFDNAFNLALIELGMIGLAAVVLFIGTTLVRCWSATAKASSEEAILPIAGVVGSLALLAGGATFDAWTFDQFFPTCLILLGLGLGRSAVILRRHATQRIPVHARKPVAA